MDKKTFFLGIIFILSGTHNSIMIIVNTIFIILASLFLIIKNKLVKNSNKNEKGNENKIINLLGEVKRSKSANNLNHVYLDKGINTDKNELNMDDKSLFIVSNRLPFTLEREDDEILVKNSSGGLITALDPVLQKYGGNWIGWSGMSLTNNEHINSGKRNYRISHVNLSENEIEQYYNGFSNDVIWPLFHSFTDKVNFNKKCWETYKKVNKDFATIVMRERESTKTNFIWIHDYHLMLVPKIIRDVDVNSKIGFFIHIPFPSYDIFRILPHGIDILYSILSSDLIGFHTNTYVQHFLDCIDMMLGLRIDYNNKLIEFGERTIKVGAYPIGIDFNKFNKLSENIEINNNDKLKKIVGIDRLDYTKGVIERIKAFELFLEKYPKFRENIEMVQLTVPSREKVQQYENIKHKIENYVCKVNGRFSTERWSPIRYIYKSISEEKLVNLYKSADICLVTALRDGMNLVAKEFVASKVDNNGVLILSNFAGASESMLGSILVNPYNSEELADKIHEALIMDNNEKIARMKLLRENIEKNNVNKWVKTILFDMSKNTKISNSSAIEYENLLGYFIGNKKISLFLDYDGTISPIVKHANEAKLGKGMMDIITNCLKNNIDITIVTGRGMDDIQSRIKNEKLVYATNHGLEIKGKGIKYFCHKELIRFKMHTQDLSKELNKLALDGAWVENKGYTLTYHYRLAPAEKHVQLCKEVSSIIKNNGFLVRNAHYALEARPPIKWDKGTAVLHILNEKYGKQWFTDNCAIYIGDDETDEDAFKVLSGIGMTFRVGNPVCHTHANRRLSNINAVHDLLYWISNRNSIQQ